MGSHTPPLTPLTPSPTLPVFRPQGPRTPPEKKPGIKKIEDYPRGYPRFTALSEAHDGYLVFRRFTRLRARLLLSKQDQLTLLENQLDKVDREEESPMFLGSSRLDRNAQRKEILSQIESKLQEYDDLVTRTHQILSLSPALPRDVESLQNWTTKTGSIARGETAYLSRRDLMSLAPAKDRATMKLEEWIEDLIVRLWCSWRKSRLEGASDDPKVHIYTGPWIPMIAKIILLFLTTFLLLIPAILHNIFQEDRARIAIYVSCTVVYLLVISLLTKSRTTELVIAGAAYAAVLIKNAHAQTRKHPDIQPTTATTYVQTQLFFTPFPLTIAPT
ncbi:hypothetical protein VTJ04DRAFT_8105 [Mycothermus thermophilus]|uniref:uncharacterized protein n=1 Tax=Humicola insolens TaxID=85995 RepID=UPI00374463C5